MKLMKVEKANLYCDCGLLGFIDSIASHRALEFFPNFIPLEPSRFDKEFWNSVKFLNWVKILENELFPELNEEIKANITELLNKTDLWLEWLKVLNKVLADFWLEEKEQTEIGLKVKAYYDFIRQQCLAKYDNLPEFAKEDVLARLNRKNESRQPQPQTKAICIHCGSSNTVSNGKLRFLCSDCGKQWLKKKTKQYTEILQ